MLVCFALFCARRLDGAVARSARPAPRGRSRRSSRSPARCSPRPLSCSLPGSAGHAAQTSPAGSRSPFDWLHLASGSLWLGGLIGLLVLWAACRPTSGSAALSVVVPRFSNVALGRVAGAARRPGRGRRSTTCRRSTRCGRPGTASAILVKIGLLARRDGARLRQPAAHQAALAAAPAPTPSVGAPAARLLRGLISGEAVLVAGGRVRGRGALEPRPAAAGVLAAELRAGEASAPAASPRPSSARLRAAGARLAEQGGRARLVRAADHTERPARPRRRA